MATPQSDTKNEVKKDDSSAPKPEGRFHPLESLRREVDRLFEDFNRGSWHLPFQRSVFDLEPAWRRMPGWNLAPAVDISEKEQAYEITAELPGIPEKDVQVTFADGVLRIKGEKKEESEEKKKDYFLSERRYGSFERSFQVPPGVDADKIAASFVNGVLKVTLPRSLEAQKREKKIDVKPG